MDEKGQKTWKIGLIEIIIVSFSTILDEIPVNHALFMHKSRFLAQWDPRRPKA